MVYISLTEIRGVKRLVPLIFLQYYTHYTILYDLSYFDAYREDEDKGLQLQLQFYASKHFRFYATRQSILWSDSMTKCTSALAPQLSDTIN